MSLPFILLPFFVQVALIFALLFWTGMQRIDALRRRATRITDVALGQRSWPDRAQQASNAYENQFELPMLFLVLAPLVLLTRKADYLFVALAWIFVVLRLVHALVHISSNHVPTRFGVFLAGALVLMLMWILFAIHVLAGV